MYINESAGPHQLATWSAPNPPPFRTLDIFRHICYHTSVAPQRRGLQCATESKEEFYLRLRGAESSIAWLSVRQVAKATKLQVTERGGDVMRALAYHDSG